MWLTTLCKECKPFQIQKNEKEVIKIAGNNRFHNKRTICKKSIATAFLIFWIGGIIGLLVDLPYIEPYLLEKIPLTLGEKNHRRYNIPMLFLAFGLIIYCYTLCRRLTIFVLKRRIKIPKWQSK